MISRINGPQQQLIAAGESLEQAANEEADCTYQITSSTTPSRPNVAFGTNGIRAPLKSGTGLSKLAMSGRRKTRRCRD